MSSGIPRPAAAMEAGGSYNRHAQLPANGAALAIPHLARVIDEVPYGPDEPIVIVDYGSSQGRNSLGPVRSAIGAIRARTGMDRAILVYHEDQPSNDFNALFELLDQSPERYSLGDPRVFPCAIGRSFYGAVLPENSVHVGWSAYAAMWASRVPALIPGHITFARSSGNVRAAFAQQGTRDWESFLSLRARELRPGGCLVVCMPGADEHGVSVFEGIMDHANAELGSMVDEGVISTEERRRMVLNVWPRRLSDLVAPFDDSGRFATLTLRHAETGTVRDAAWEEFERDGNAQALARKRALFFRSIFTPTLAAALDREYRGEPDAYIAFADRLATGLEKRVRTEPAPMRSLVQILVMAKGS